MTEKSTIHQIYLAGGCFWGTEAYFKKLPGVQKTEAGYANGRTEHPSYKDVCNNHTGHAETVHVIYDASILPTETLLKGYFKIIDPTSMNRQGNDRGIQYRSGIYYTDAKDLPIIHQMVSEEQKKYQQPIVTEVLPISNFYPAEEYHQDYLDKNPGGYCHINLNTADDFIREEDLKKKELKETLTDLQFRVTQNGETEPPFANPYAGVFEKGIYVDVITGKPLFLSSDKFESECGWPSFSKPITPELIQECTDTKFHMIRTEVRSAASGSHLGHVFPDGPKETGGLRYCINSAALRFIPFEKMETEGYGHLKYLVD